MDPPPAVEGQGHIALDAENGPANVEAVLATEAWSGTYNVQGSSIRTAPVCVTPCIANVPYGTHQLIFTNVNDRGLTSRGTVTVGAKPSVYRYKIGDNTRHGGRLVGAILIGSGAFGLSLGALATGSTPLLVTGLIGFGVMALLGMNSITEQEGAGTQWSPEDGVIYSH